MGKISADVWGAVMTFCDAVTVCELRVTNSWFAAACTRDFVWADKLRQKFMLSGEEEPVTHVLPGLTRCELYRAIQALTIEQVPLKIKSSDGPEWGHCYRAELMLGAKVKGTYCTAPGVTKVTLGCKASTPFLLDHIRAKGGGKGFSSPLKTFRLTLTCKGRAFTIGPFALEDDPSTEHVFKLPAPVLADAVDIDLLSGGSGNDNIDTEYVELHGRLLQPGAAPPLTRTSSAGNGLVVCPQRLTVCQSP